MEHIIEKRYVGSCHHEWKNELHTISGYDVKKVRPKDEVILRRRRMDKQFTSRI